VKILVGMSGGVDSAVTAWYLQKAGASVLGCYVVAKDEDPEEMRRVEAIVSCLKISCRYVFKKKIMERAIIDPMIRDYGAGKTPNPCLHCNATIKFPALLQVMEEEGASRVATGHYVRKSATSQGFVLKKGIDSGKDQSSMLSQLSKNMLPRLMFPLGAFHKEIIRLMGLKAFGDLFSTVPESQDLCFLKNQNLQEFLEQHLSEEIKKEGPIISHEGNLLGKHSGLFRHTVGQRKGLGLSQGPWFVYDICRSTNALYVGPSEKLSVFQLWCSSVNWFVPPEFLGKKPLHVTVRYGAKPVEVHSFSFSKELLWVQTATNLQGVAPGQGLVLYAKDVMVCGAIIQKTEGRSCNERICGHL
jgi:tRNA-specific 2-thiouridylase